MNINLAKDENIYKISMGMGEIDAKDYPYFSQHNLIVVHKNTKAKGTSKTTQANVFIEQMKIGDYFYLCRGNKSLELVGKVTSDAKICDDPSWGSDGWMQRSYEIIKKSEKKDPYIGDSKWWTPNNNSTCIVIPKSEIEYANQKLFLPSFNLEFKEALSNNNQIREQSMQNADNSIGIQPLNQILFGAPGTGKTYKTKRLAVEIITGRKYDENKRDEINQEYKTLLDAGQIVFTTFHQSLSYEDFIEGIKPKMENSEISYEVKDGIFKNICKKAINSDFIVGELIGNYEVSKVGAEIIYLKAPRSGSIIPVPKYLINELADLVKKGEINYENIKNETAINFMHETTEKFIINGYPKIFAKLVENLLEKEREHQKHVLIIDEINRGNVSAIFGELITLLEEDKRKGADEAIEVVLPYSNEKFSIPSNVYIVGTMNTADRSVEALDAALRRRFSFVEMKANYKVLKENQYKEVNLSQLLDVMNQRIEFLIDKDHQIGHAYLINITDFESLKLTFTNKIIPLLEEYFYGDFGKIGLILGEKFIQEKANTIKLKNFSDEMSYFDSKKVYQFTDANNWTEETFKSIYEDK